ncbi:MAG: hypothetical protein GXX79_16230 [Actinomycetales bacterium]|nr:hypothetical protein [Actinomycetales bacterium]
MSTWSWRFEGPDGTAVEPAGIGRPLFPNQADAETWVGESWRALLEAGVEQVRLYEDAREVYGPMGLRPSE